MVTGARGASGAPLQGDMDLEREKMKFQIAQEEKVGCERRKKEGK